MSLEKDEFTLACPVPITDNTTVQMAHGGGGRLMQRLLDQIITPAFRNPILDQRHDSATLTLPDNAGIQVFGYSGIQDTAPAPGAPNTRPEGQYRNSPLPRLAFTTDSYVVRPLFFPGGDIGELAVNGTVNDLAMGGARPLWISVGFILEEGLPMETLQRIVASMRRAADAAGVQIVTGDTKVVDRGKGDGIFINTAGVGIMEHDLTIGPGSVREGDAVLLSGDIGRHGITIMATREGLAFETAVESDCAPLVAPVRRLFEAGIDIHCLRDLTRGGLASGVVEIAEATGLHIHIIDEAIPVEENVRAACELLGFDPLYVANEGRFIAFVPADQEERALAALRSDPLCANAAVIGHVDSKHEGLVTLRSRIGTNRIVDMLSGEQLPRIC